MSIRLCTPATFVKKISCLVAGIVSFNTVESWNTKFLNSECFLLTLMFTIWLIIYASTLAFNLLARAFNLPTRALNFATCAFSLLTRGFNLLTRAFNLPTRVFKLAAHASSLLTRGFELITRRFELVTREFEFVTHRFELVTRGFEFVTDNLCYTFHTLTKYWHFKFIQRWVFHQQYFIAVSGILSFTPLRDLISSGSFLYCPMSFPTNSSRLEVSGSSEEELSPNMNLFIICGTLAVHVALRVFREILKDFVSV